uniref:XK-related protein n=1 Tax=Acrobeloides nanus TaxID=290746 RepID=A0A914CJC1_9BILA
MISTAFTFLWIGYPLAVFNTSFNLGVVQLVWFIIFVPSLVINGTSLVANQGEEKRELYQIYLKLGLIRLPLEIYALAKSYSPHTPYSYNFRIFEKLNLYGLSEQVILWAIIIESLLGLVLVYFRLRSVKSGDTEGPEVKPGDTKGLHGVYTLGVVVVGLLEILGSIVFAVLVITGIGRMIPINSLVCAPLWMGTVVFGALLIFNRMINSTKILKGYLVFATFRLMVGIATAIFFLTGLLEAINSNQDILCERNNGLYTLYFCFTSNRKSNYSMTLVVLGVLFIIGMISIGVIYRAFKQHRKLVLEEGNNDEKGKNVDRNLDFYRSQAKMDLCPYELSKNFIYEQ